MYIPPLLLQRPNAILLDDFNRAVFIKRSTSRFEDGSSSNGVSERGQGAGVELLEGDFSVVEVVYGVDEFLKGDVAVADLAGEIAFFVGGVFHVESWGFLLVSWFMGLVKWGGRTGCTRGDRCRRR